MKSKILKSILFIALILFVYFYYINTRPPFQILTGETMNTYYRITIRSNNEDTLLHNEIKNELQLINNEMSVFENMSDLSQFNKNKDEGWIDVPETLTDILQKSYNLYVHTNGYFDPSVGKLVDIWGFGKNKNVKILVVLHLYYMNSWKSIKQYLDNLKGYNYDLVVTYTDENYKQSVLEKILKYKQNTKLFKYKNKGFDIGPFIDVISRLDISDYDIVFKLHSKGVRRKRIFIYNQIFKYKDWFYNLYDGILGAFAVHKVIDVFATDQKVGLVASKNLIVHDPKHKQFFTKQVADKYKLKIKDNYQYVAGSCFVIRTQCLEKIKKLNLTIDSFADTKRGEFSLAHAMERLVCAMVETMNLKFYGIPVVHNLYKKELEDAQKTSAIRLLDDDRINLDYEFFYKALEGRKIKNYFIKEIALKDINNPINEAAEIAKTNVLNKSS
mgnify:CR=1 FL=1